MGEYLTYKGQHVKIGTCENLYYTTLPQFKEALPFFKPMENAEQYLEPNTYRFRFPFPDEKRIDLGDYNEYNRGVCFTIPKGILEIAHTDNCNYLTNDLPVMAFEVIQQKIVKEGDKIEIQTVVRCPHCQAVCRLSEDEVNKLIDYMAYNPQNFTDLQIKIAAIMERGYSDKMKMRLEYVGRDYFDRLVFKSESGRFYKQYEKEPEIWTAAGFEGEPECQFHLSKDAEFRFIGL